MSDPVVTAPEVDEEDAAAANTDVVDQYGQRHPAQEAMHPAGEAVVEPTDDLASLDDIHAQAAQNRIAMGPQANDPTVVTAGTDPISAPGPGPEDDAKLVAATAGALRYTETGPVSAEALRQGGANSEIVAEREAAEAAEADELAALGTGGDEGEYEQVDSDYDPGEYTVAEVNDYIAEHPEEADAIYAAEQSGKARAGILG
jgi:hypothetical protein